MAPKRDSGTLLTVGPSKTKSEGWFVLKEAEPGIGQRPEGREAGEVAIDGNSDPSPSPSPNSIDSICLL